MKEIGEGAEKRGNRASAERNEVEEDPMDEGSG